VGNGPDRGGRGALTPARTALLGAVVGLLYAVVLSVRGDPAPGVVGGVLLAVLIVLVVRRVQAYNELARRRAAARRRPPPG
jgi:hypothetical protein